MNETQGGEKGGGGGGGGGGGRGDEENGEQNSVESITNRGYWRLAEVCF